VTGQEVLAAAAAAVIVFALGALRSRAPRLAVAGGILVAAALVAIAAGAVTLPRLDAVMADVADSVGPEAYPLAAGLAFLETGAFVGLVAPGETAVVLAGAVAARHAAVDPIPLALLIWAAAAAGDLASFALGRRLGRGFLTKHGPRLRMGPERLHSVESFFDRHGGKAVLVGRFIGIVRATAPFLAGSSGMALRRFVPYSLLGTGLWAAVFTGVGFAFSSVATHAADLTANVLLGAALAAGLALLWHARRQPARSSAPKSTPTPSPASASCPT
jgi:membrane protein DedA with SNARE-associated domain